MSSSRITPSGFLAYTPHPDDDDDSRRQRQHDEMLLPMHLQRRSWVSRIEESTTATSPPLPDQLKESCNTVKSKNSQEGKPQHDHDFDHFDRKGAPMQWVQAATMVGHFRPKYSHEASPLKHGSMFSGTYLSLQESKLMEQQRAASTEPMSSHLHQQLKEQQMQRGMEGLQATLRSRSSLSVTPQQGNRGSRNASQIGPRSGNPSQQQLLNLTANSSMMLSPHQLEASIGRLSNADLLANTSGDMVVEESAEEAMIRQLIANSPRRFHVPDWSAMDPYTANERGILEGVSRCRTEPREYAETLESKLTIWLPSEAALELDEDEAPTNPLDAPPPEDDATKVARGWIRFTGSAAANAYIDNLQQSLNAIPDTSESMSNAPPLTKAQEKELKKAEKEKEKAKKGKQLGVSEVENEFEEQQMRIQAKQRLIERCQEIVRNTTAFLDKLKAINGSLPRAGYNRGMTLAAREIASKIGQGKRTLSLQDHLAQFGKLTGEVTEYIVYGVKDPLVTVEELVMQALKSGDDKVLLYPTKLYAGAGWQKHSTRGAVSVVLIASGFQEISYIKKHRNLPIVELKRCMSLGQMSADERLYDLNFIPEHYGIRALRPVAHPVMCGAKVELVLQCPPMITLSCATESGPDDAPCQSFGTTFVDRIGRTAKVYATMLENKPTKLIVYARHPNELVYKKASTVLLRPVKSMWRASEAITFPDQLEQFQIIQGELIAPRNSNLKEDGEPVSFVVRFLAPTKTCVLKGTHGQTELLRTAPPAQRPRQSIAGAALASSPSFVSSPSAANNDSTNRSPTTYSTSLVLKAGALSMWVDELCVLRWTVSSGLE